MIQTYMNTKDIIGQWFTGHFSYKMSRETKTNHRNAYVLFEILGIQVKYDHETLVLIQVPY